MKLNGYQRIYIVLIFIFLGVVVFFSVKELSYINSRIKDKNKIINDKTYELTYSACKNGKKYELLSLLEKIYPDSPKYKKFYKSNRESWGMNANLVIESIRLRVEEIERDNRNLFKNNTVYNKINVRYEQCVTEETVKYKKELSQEVNRLKTSEKHKLLLFSLVRFIVPVVFVYLITWLIFWKIIPWVTRGFKQEKK